MMLRFRFTRARWLSAAIALIFIGGCSRSTTPLPAIATRTPQLSAPLPTATPFPPEPTTTPGPTPSPIPSDTPTPTATPRPQRTQYDLRVRLDFSSQSLDVQQTIGYVNRSAQALDELILVVDPNVQFGVFELQSLAWQNSGPVQDFDLDRNTLQVPLPEPLIPGGRIALELTFTLALRYKIGGFGYNERETILIDWYPFVPPYHPEDGWQVNRPWPHGEYLEYEPADFVVHIQPTGDPADAPMLAAPVPPSVENGWHTFRMEGARAFAWSASREYAQLARQAGDTTIRAFFFPEHSRAAQAGLDTAAQSLAIFGELFGPYNRDYYTIVEAAYSDGAEADGLIFLSYNYHAEFDDTAQNFFTLLVAHETAHQWWYASVGSDPAHEPWLDEALATYSEALFYERYYPELLDWWWLFRVNYFRPSGPVNGELYDFGTFFPYVYAVYLRGALLFQDLRAQIGDEAFFSFLQTYAADHAGQEATTEGFMAALEAASPAALPDIFSRYFNP